MFHRLILNAMRSGFMNLDQHKDTPMVVLVLFILPLWFSVVWMSCLYCLLIFDLFSVSLLFYGVGGFSIVNLYL